MSNHGYAVKASFNLFHSGFKAFLIAILVVAALGGVFYFNERQDPPFANEILREHLDGAQQISGRVVRITDGDTFEMLAAGNKKLRIRIHGIDAPEREQPFYRKSRDFLGSLCFHKEVTIKVVEKDRWGRLVAHAFTPDGKSIGYQMVENGFAWHFIRYSRDPNLKKLENSARMRKAGLWADKNPVAPWKWRRGSKT